MATPNAQFMRRAIELAEQGRGSAAPNPTVGAVLVSDGHIVAEGYHTACGQPHAEIECLRAAQQAGVNPADCTMYVTLEPCNHYGKTPPCSKAILEAGISHVVIGLMDPNPKAKGGAEFLQEHGVVVEKGVLEDECRELVKDFLHWIATPYPYTLLKLASTLDGKIATRTGHSQWISGEASRTHVHALRKKVDAVIVGGETFRADNPQLTCRLEGVVKQPLAVIVTSHLPESPAAFRLLTERPEQVIFWTNEKTALSEAASTLQALGCTVKSLPDADEKLDLRAGLAWLRQEKNCHYTLCEGGGNLALSLLESNLVNEFELHMAPKIVGDENAPDIFSGRSIATMHEALQLQIVNTERSGEDVIITLRPQET
ncbi:MAG: bifunctional diaminohydroxyphosphoribosylaminopyrimidine deaminase/5-amino-6-(5-phosphoribosylamino)uracil reductase RibD [Desulfovibrionales bacterium]|nr:bifunctional diaminohydroxyphosphoribosylaminopyrimidine deaminase/5-amino-6-(5-phosphoribosylamino)uracil reductase RibD [Desulfovibrionales bacterium]